MRAPAGTVRSRNAASVFTSARSPTPAPRAIFSHAFSRRPVGGRSPSVRVTAGLCQGSAEGGVVALVEHQRALGRGYRKEPQRETEQEHRTKPDTRVCHEPTHCHATTIRASAVPCLNNLPETYAFCRNFAPSPVGGPPTSAMRETPTLW